jgi:hypothetical protein
LMPPRTILFRELVSWQVGGRYFKWLMWTVGSSFPNLNRYEYFTCFLALPELTL